MPHYPTHPGSTPEPDSGRPSGAKWRIGLVSLALACALTGGQVILATMSARGETWTDRYLSLCSWDGGWYRSIVEDGYRTSNVAGAGQQTNVAFFPGYPIAAKAISGSFGLSTTVSLLVASQLAVLGFWWVVLRSLQHWCVTASVRLAVVMLIFSHPGAFYLVVSYADSLFLASLLIFLCYGNRANQSVTYLCLAAAAGYIMSTTRIMGAPLATLPIVWVLAESYRGSSGPFRFAEFSGRVWRYGVVAISTALGAISFFVFCAVRFGHWDEYMRARAAGWEVSKVDYSAMFRLEHLRIFVPRFSDDFLSPVDLNQLSVAFLILALLLVPLLDCIWSRRKPISGIAQRVPFYVAAWLMFLISAAGSSLPLGSYIGFLRYGLFGYVLILLALAHAHSRSRYAAQELPIGLQIPIFLGAAAGLAMQLQFCRLYAHAVMVA